MGAVWRIDILGATVALPSIQALHAYLVVAIDKMKQYRIKEFQWGDAQAFVAEESLDGKEWDEVPLFPVCRSLISAKQQLAHWTKPAPKPIYHPYP